MTQKPVPPKNEPDTGILEELAECEDTGLTPLDEGGAGLFRIAENVLHRDIIDTAIRLFNNPNMAVMILDSNLTIVYSSPRTNLLFQNYYTITRRPFLNIFMLSLEHSDLQDLLISLKSYERAYSWTGTLRHKTPKTKTMHTHTVISPFIADNQEVAGYHVFFEDISDGYNRQLQTTFKSILEAAKLKDNDTGLHDERVSFYCRKMAEYLYSIQKYPQIDPDFIENIGFLAAMHDVGKIGTPDYILQKPGMLTEQEWDIMREHTINGTFILSSYPAPMAKEIALSHHERWNGTGYPFRLEGEMIPLSARIVSIADVYDALRMKRTYKNEYNHEETVSRILAGTGTQFDPTLVDVFMRIHNDFDDIWNLLKDTGPRSPSLGDHSKEFTESL